MGYIIIGFLLSVSAGLVAFVDKKKANEEVQKPNKYNLLAFIVLLIGACLSLWSGYNSQISSNKAEHKADSVNKVIIAKQTTIDSINRLLFIKQDDVIKLQKIQIDTASRILSTSLKTNLLQQQIGQLQNKLINEVTGGDNKPFLMLTTTKLLLDANSGKKYFLLFFDILNKGDYSLQNVKATVYDNWSSTSLRYGIKHFRDGMAGGTMRVKPEEYEKFNPVNHFDNIATITKNKPYPLYTTTFCTEITNQIQPDYQVEIAWYNGSFTYFINLKIVGDKLKLDSVELLLNRHKIEYKNNFSFNK